MHAVSYDFSVFLVDDIFDIMYYKPTSLLKVNVVRNDDNAVTSLQVPSQPRPRQVRGATEQLEVAVGETGQCH